MADDRTRDIEQGPDQSPGPERDGPERDGPERDGPERVGSEQRPGPDRDRNVDRYVKGPEPTAEELAHHRDQAAARDALPDPDPNAQERDPQAAILSDAVRRAHDQELSALANIALIRAGLFGGRGGGFLPGQPADRRDMDTRLRDILDEPDRR